MEGVVACDKKVNLTEFQDAADKLADTLSVDLEIKEEAADTTPALKSA